MIILIPLSFMNSFCYLSYFLLVLFLAINRKFWLVVRPCVLNIHRESFWLTLSSSGHDFLCFLEDSYSRADYLQSRHELIKGCVAIVVRLRLELIIPILGYSSPETPISSLDCLLESLPIGNSNFYLFSILWLEHSALLSSLFI